MSCHVMTWKSMSWQGSLCHDMEVYVTIWKSLSWHRPISSKSDIQKSPITKKCMVVKGLRNPIEWPYKLTKIDESRFVGSSITPHHSHELRRGVESTRVETNEPIPLWEKWAGQRWSWRKAHCESWRNRKWTLHSHILLWTRSSCSCLLFSLC